MPRFFLESAIDDDIVPDKVGADAPDLKAARGLAREALADLAAECIGRGGQSCAVTILDEAGNRVVSLGRGMAGNEGLGGRG